MMRAIEHVTGALRGDHTIGAAPGEGRVFFVCRDCRRVVPRWRLLQSRRTGPIGCRCGGDTFHARNIPEWRAALWVLVVGLVWRRLILRRSDDWDPRIPDRAVPSRSP